MTDNERIVKGEMSMENTEGALLLSAEQCAKLLGLGRTYIFRLLAEGRLESIALGRRRLIPRDALDAFIAAERERQAAENEGEAMSQGWPTSPERPKGSGTPR